MRRRRYSTKGQVKAALLSFAKDRPQMADLISDDPIQVSRNLGIQMYHKQMAPHLLAVGAKVSGGDPVVLIPFGLPDGLEKEVAWRAVLECLQGGLNRSDPEYDFEIGVSRY